MSTPDYDKPVPVPDEDTAPFWNAARQHDLAFQRCDHCGAFAHPPVAFCLRCNEVTTPSFTFERVEPTARVVNWTLIQDQMVAGFEDEPPICWVLGEMTAHPGLFYPAALIDYVESDLQIGAVLDVVFRDVAPMTTLPYFRPAPAT
ncbi:Zn-ribbon domain-containing OB-fold protein [Pseudonocardia sp. N23]|uniref:Zn-ribbon domain-containing OB-fold protein n=1 Tax=Pseudonocardia sp. N23 TaxID=1987376 RepID=UPI000BFC7610|nr:zinc ribbon domain-containing protein [Pseudonocardia sp. N23]GAY11619.1 hypothetical protein TOK_6134 [Pseudonocardia sp. N23]